MSFYHIFLSIEEQKEVNTEYILSILSGKDKNILISKSDFDSRHNRPIFYSPIVPKLKRTIITSLSLLDGIEISNDKVDVVFIPLLAFDMQGNRVGYGKGFYDRFLARL